MSDLAVREIPSLERFRANLEELEMSGLAHVLAVTDAAMAYAKVTKSVEMMNDATELRLWTERRAGEIVAKDDPAEVAAELQTRSPIVRRWIFFASITADDFEKSIASIRHSRDLSVSGLFEHIVFWFGKEVSSGVRKLPDGRYRIHWKTLEGTTKTRTLDCSYQVAKAERAYRFDLEKERRTVRENKSWKKLDVAYSRIRRLLGELDALSPSLDSDTREEVATAISGLHAAEDALADAMKSAEAYALADKREAEFADAAERMQKAIE